jgi:uncharacterized membrane protein
MWSNLNLLFWLSLIPFATGWMGENHFEPFPVALYGALLAICGLSYTILQNVIQLCNKNDEKLKFIMQRQKWKGIVSSILYIAAMLLAYTTTIISGCIFVIVAILWLVPDKKIENLFNNGH